MERGPLLLALLQFLVAPRELLAQSEFGYDGELGPDHWSSQYHTCAGKFQSPIDIEEHLVQQVRQPALTFKGFRSLPVTSTLYNNGHTVMLQLNMSETAVVSGGPLGEDEYIFAQLHFHWGANDSVGSEDTINNHTFPLELHMVLYNNKYGNFENALQHQDGLAVVALFYELYGPDNHIYSEIVDVLPSIVLPNTNARLKRQITLDSLLPLNRELYFTYHGSLTTPPCSEVVTWIEFKMPILLSHKQITAFRKIRSNEGQLTNNYRPVQPLAGRTVYFNVGVKSKASENIQRISPLLVMAVAILNLSFRNL